MANTRNPMMVKGTPPVMRASLERTSAQAPSRGLNVGPMKLSTGGVVHLPKAFAAGAQKWGHTPHFHAFVHAYSDRVRAIKKGKSRGFTKVGGGGLLG
jgi:hypothetical protein